MSSPLLNNLDREDHDFAFLFQDSDDLLPILEDNNTSLTIEDYGINVEALYPTIFHQEISSVSEARINHISLEHTLKHHNVKSSQVPFETSDNTCALVQEKSTIALENDNANCDWNSCVFHEQENASAILNEPNIDNNLSIAFKTSETLCLTLEECSLPLSNKSHDTNGSASDPSMFLEQLNSALEPSIHKEFRESMNSCNDNIFSSFVEASDDPVPLVEQGSTILALLEDDECNEGLESIMLPQKITSAVTAHRIDEGLFEQKLTDKEKERNDAIEEHNAKERVRRMKLYATYLSLGELLPDTPNKKKRSAPVIIDRALEYIPELENEIQKLTLKKTNALSAIPNKQTINQEPELEHQTPAVSVHEVKKGEVIIQVICIPNAEDTILSKLLQYLEAEGARIISVSTLQVCEKRVSYHLHLQMNVDSLANNYVAVLREDLISWLL